jgi:hypothetical protein
MLKKAFKDHHITEKIITVEDDLMSGPIGNILLDPVQALRLGWWEQVLNEEDKTWVLPYLRDNYKSSTQLINAFSDDVSLLFWVGDSATEQLGFMCMLAYLPNSIPVSVVNVSLAYYKRYGKLRPFSSGEISPDKMLPLMEDAKSLSPRVRLGYVTNWIRLLEEEGMLRIKKGNQVVTVPESYFDQEIIYRARKICRERIYRKTDGFIPSMRLVGEVIGHQKQTVSDIFIEWRIRCLVEMGVFVYQGSLNHMRLYKIKPTVDAIN